MPIDNPDSGDKSKRSGWWERASGYKNVEQTQEELLERTIQKLKNYIPEENRPTLERSTRIAGVPRKAREEIVRSQREWVEGLEAEFDEPSSKAGKALEVQLAAFVVKNDDEGGGLRWAGRKSTAVLAHQVQDYGEGKTDLIVILQGAEESYAPSQTAMRIDACTGETSLIKKLRRNIDYLKTGHMKELPFTTLPLGGGLDIQGANLENAPLMLAAFDRASVIENAGFADDESKWGILSRHVRQIEFLQQLESQADAYRSYLLNHLPQFKEEWKQQVSELRAKQRKYREDAPKTPTEHRESKSIGYRLYQLRKSQNPKTIEKTFQTLAQNQHAAHERKLERIQVLYGAELRTYRLQIGREVGRFEGADLTEREREACGRMRRWIALGRHVERIPLAETDILYRAAWRLGMLPYRTVLDYVSEDPLHLELMAAARVVVTDVSSTEGPPGSFIRNESVPLLDAIDAIPKEDFGNRMTEGKKRLGPVLYEFQRTLRDTARDGRKLVTLDDVNEALEKFPYPDEKNRVAYLTLTIGQENSEPMETREKLLPARIERTNAEPEAVSGSEASRENERELIRKRLMVLEVEMLRRRLQ